MPTKFEDRDRPVLPAREYNAYGKPVMRFTWPMIIGLFGIGGFALLSLSLIIYGLWN